MDWSVGVLVGSGISVGWIVAVIVGSGSGVSVIGNGVFAGGWEVIVDAGEVVVAVLAEGFLGLQVVITNGISMQKISDFRMMLLQQISDPSEFSYSLYFYHIHARPTSDSYLISG